MMNGVVNAALVERLGGLAYYDTEANLTWLTDANAAGITMSWTDANNWAAGLTVSGVSNWRLPESDNCYQYNCTGSEMGNMFYNVLGGNAMELITTTHNANYELFSNIQASVNSVYYWSATEDFIVGDTAALRFNMGSGFQSNNIKSSNFYAWAVQSGDVSAVPVPPAMLVFVSGLIGLIGFARNKQT